MKLKFFLIKSKNILFAFTKKISFSFKRLIKKLPSQWRKTIFIKNLFIGSALTLVGATILSISFIKKNNNIKETQKIELQKTIVENIEESKLKFEKIIQDNPNAKKIKENISTKNSLKNIISFLEKELCSEKINFKIKNITNIKNIFSKINISIDLKTPNDSDVAYFTKKLSEYTPGFICFNNIKIKRIGKILNKQEFSKTIEKYKKTGKRMLNFESNIDCEVIIPQTHTKNFTS